jgi:cell division septation protein DedD
MRLVRLTLICLSLAMLGTVSGCSHEKRDWHSAQAADTIEAYEQFVKEHPKSARTSAAQTRIEQLTEDRDWQRASGTDTADAYRQFLAAHPQSKSAQEARVRIENFAMTGGPAAAAQGTASQPASAPPAPPPPTSRAAASEPASGAMASVQLGAFSTRAKAQRQWRRLTGRFQTELHGAISDIERGKSSRGRPVYRLKAKVADESAARSLCAQLKQHDEACVVSGARR